MNIIMKSVVFLMLILPDGIPAPRAIAGESGGTVAAGGGGAQRWSGGWTMEPAQENGRPAVHFTEEGKGQYSGFTGPISWTADAVWSADGTLRPLRSEKVVKDANGKVIEKERMRFDPARGSVKYERERDGRIVESKQMSVPPDTLAPEGIAGILRFLPFDHLRKQTVHILSNEPKLYEVKVEMRGRERVKTPAGEFECYKVEMVPELGALNLVRPFLPKEYFWFSTEPSHFWVKYEGLENGPGTPQISMELRTYQPN